jgi:hypothetical protein
MWAELLVRAWIDGRISASDSNSSISEAVRHLAQTWRATADPGAGAPWYLSAKAGRGAHSTIIGVEFTHVGRLWQWKALAVGDTDMFVLTADDVLVYAYPLSDPAAFTSSPFLVSTGGENAALAPGQRLRRRGVLRSGDRLMVATDALAKCLLVAHQAGEPLWGDAAAAVRSRRGFADWVASLREGGRLEDDDTTLMLVRRGA